MTQSLYETDCPPPSLSLCFRFLTREGESVYGKKGRRTRGGGGGIDKYPIVIFMGCVDRAARLPLFYGREFARFRYVIHLSGSRGWVGADVEIRHRREATNSRATTRVSQISSIAMCSRCIALACDHWLLHHDDVPFTVKTIHSRY